MGKRQPKKEELTMLDDLGEAMTPEGQKFVRICGKAMVMFDPDNCSIGNDFPLLEFLLEITEYKKLSTIVLNGEYDMEDGLCELTDITRDVSLAVGFILGQELDITIPEAQKYLRAIKKVMKEKQAIPWMAMERKGGSHEDQEK